MDFKKFTKKDFNNVETYDHKAAHIISISTGEKCIEVCFEDQDGFWHHMFLRSDGVHKNPHQPLIVSTREEDKVVETPKPQIIAKGFTLVSKMADGREVGHTIYATYEECLRHKKPHHEIITVG